MAPRQMTLQLLMDRAFLAAATFCQPQQNAQSNRKQTADGMLRISEA